MKTTNIFLLVIVMGVFATMLLGFSSYTETETENGIVTMRTVESSIGTTLESNISIVYEDGKVEIIELKKIKAGNTYVNLPTINQTLNVIKSKGYRLISTAGGDYITTYTFSKE